MMEASKRQVERTRKKFSRKRKRKLLLSWTFNSAQRGGSNICLTITGIIVLLSIIGKQMSAAKTVKHSTVASKADELKISHNATLHSLASVSQSRFEIVPSEPENVVVEPKARNRRWSSPAAHKDVATTHIVAVSGHWIELQCPLASELSALANSDSSSGARAAPDQSIIWRKNGTKLNQLNPRQKVHQLNGSLIIVSAQPASDEASYECALVHDNDPERTLKTHRFQLKLLVAPRLAPFEFPPDAQVGMKLVLTCSALEGHQPISFVWLKDKQIINLEQQYQLAGSGVHQAGKSLSQFHQQQLADKLSLAAQPAFGQQGATKQEYVILGADAGSSPPDSDSQQLLPVLSDPNIRIRQSDDYSILSIDRLELKHSGRYTCSGQNEVARSSHSSQLLINAPPTLTLEPKDTDLVSGQSAVIDCAASGQPRPSISWLRARESSNKLWDYLPVYDNLRFSTLANGSLSIGNVTQREQGFYLCSARNGFGPETSKLIKITVHEPAKFSSKYQTLEVRVDDRANMLCVASGELPLSIEWLDKNSNVIQRNDKRFIIDNEPADLVPGQLTNSTLSRLILARANRLDSGQYACQATNKYGSDKMLTNLLVQDVPDKVTELAVTNATSSTISIRWQLAFNGNSPVSSYLVQYQSDDPLYDLLMSPVPRVPTSPTSGPPELGPSQGSSLKAALDALNIAPGIDDTDEAIDRTLVELTVEQSSSHLVIKDLNPYCVYRLRLAAINKIGLGDFSEWVRAKTEEAPPSGTALRITAAATGPNSIKVTWNSPDRRTWNGQLVGFNIGYRPIDSNFEMNKTIEWTPPTVQSLMLDAEGQIHKQRVLADSPENTPQTNKQSGAQMQSLVGTSKSSNAEAKRAANSSAPETSQNSNAFQRQRLRQILALQQHELVAHLTNLQRSTTYLVWIQAVNNRGYGPQSHAISVKTLDDVPPSAPALRIQSTTPSSITIAWSMLTNFVGFANQYSLFYRRVPHLANQNRNNSSQLDVTHMMTVDGVQTPAHLLEPGAFIERTINSEQLMLNNNMFLPVDQEQVSESKASFMHQHYQQFVYTLDKLECGSIYELYMITRNSVGKSEPSSVVTTRTLGEPPLAPTNKNSLFAKIAMNDVALNLAAWSTGGCPMTHILVRYKLAPMTVSNLVASVANSTQTPPPSWPITASVPSNLVTMINEHQILESRAYSNGQLKSDLQPYYSIKNLSPSTCYELEIVAYNAAGYTTAQYEFVTANANGTRSGYSRREGVYRIDQRGTHMDQLDNNQRIHEQQPSFSIQTGSNNQLVPMILTILCFVCVVLSSAFCYFRLTDSWSRSSNANSSGSSFRGQAPNPSPSSMGKSSMWRLNNHFTGHSHTMKHHLRDLDQDSPTTVHYCMREPSSNQMMSTTLNPKNQSLFKQSVSMKDFNVISPNGDPTLKFKSYRSSGGPSVLAEPKVGLRSRVPSEQQSYETEPLNQNYNSATLNHNQLCSIYTAACKQKQALEGSTFVPTGRSLPPGTEQTSFTNKSSPYGLDQCNYSTDGNQQDTSWPNYANQQQCMSKHNSNGTTYAIPSGAYGIQGAVETKHDEKQFDYGLDNGQASIDACIQQIMSEQYQQQHQQYAVIVNPKMNPNKCLHASENCVSQSGQAGTVSEITCVSTNCGQSVIDSSSSSSGIDIGAHLDCVSAITGTSHSNANSTTYQMNQSGCAQESSLDHFKPNLVARSIDEKNF